MFKGYDLEQGCEVAWNCVNLNSISEKQKKLLSEEISLIKKLDHPNIIRCRGAWVSARSQCVFITELLSGGSLKSYLRRIKSPRRRVVKNWCQNILKGLDYLHTRSPPVVHRDIKPDNIFIDSVKGTAFIGDLGLSTGMMSSHKESFIGTPCYMAPEIYDQNYGPCADIYAFGMCVLEVCTQNPPYSECSSGAAVYKKIINRVQPLALRSVLDKELSEFIQLCLLPANQRPSAQELLNHSFLNTESRSVDREQVKIDHSVFENLKSQEQVWIDMNIKKGVDIGFYFNLEKDTAESVAAEMVNELQLDCLEAKALSVKIQNILQNTNISVPYSQTPLIQI